jgi:ParB family chromosome partitioning protein
MVTTTATLNQISEFVHESMGHRNRHRSTSLSPVPHKRDVGRRPVRSIGKIAIEQVVPDPNQPRKEFDEDDIKRLADSLTRHGQISPIRVRWCDQLERWIIVAGERRWRASQFAGLKTIDCFFHDAPLSEEEVLEEQIVENCLRADLTPLEQARAFQSLMTINSWTGKQVAQSLCIPESKVSRQLALLKLPPPIQDTVDRGQIPPRTGYELSKVRDLEKQKRLADQAISGQLTAKATNRQTPKQSRGKPKPRGVKLPFVCENGVKTVMTSSKRATYHDIEQALVDAIEEVRHRIANNRRLY